MSNKKETSVLFIELDTLFDTRLSILGQLTDEQLANNLKNYLDRKIDDFDGLSFEQFQELYNKRDKSIMKDAGISEVAMMVNDFAKKTIKLNYTGPYDVRPKIIVNTYPYVLTEDESSVIVESVFSVADKLADVELVHMTYDEITPKYLKDNVSVIVLYEYYKWLEAHSVSGVFKKQSCPEVSMLGPRIYFKRPESNIKSDPFKAMCELAAPFISLKLLPIKIFSYIGLQSE